LETLVKLKNLGKSENTLKIVAYRLKVLNRNCNLEDPESVNKFLANLKASNSYKDTFVKSYGYYVKFNGLKWNRPRYKWERKIPKIPTKEAIMKIVSASSKKYAVIFKVLMETGVMPHELSNVKPKDIDFERGILNVEGFKGHSSRCFKLSTETLAMLKWYFSKYNSFPESRAINKAWQTYRNRVSEKLEDVSLRNIRLYDLRHYYATMLYHKTRDILLVKQQLGHKRLETSLIYTQLLSLNEEDEYHTAIAKTVKEAEQLIANGFEYVTTFDNIMIFRKRK
jgi:integrase